MPNSSRAHEPAQQASIKRLRLALGTFVAVEAVSATPELAAAALEAAYAAIEEVSRRMRPGTAGSDLARINEAPMLSPVHVHSSVIELLSLARELNVLTDGVFDPCLPTKPGRLRDIEFSDRAVVCHAPVALDFGGFAKGYAVDRATDALMNAGCTAGLVNAGGDLRVFGEQSSPVRVRGRSGSLRRVELNDAALAVSDPESSQRPPEHQGYYIRDREATLATGQIAVMAGEACLADALTKCVLLCPQEVAARALDVFGAERLADQ